LDLPDLPPRVGITTSSSPRGARYGIRPTSLGFLWSSVVRVSLAFLSKGMDFGLGDLTTWISRETQLLSKCPRALTGGGL